MNITHFNNIPYIYTAQGEKVAKQMIDGTYTYYAGNFVYNGNTLDYILFDEGQIKTLVGGYIYQYSLKDHLGNTRVVFQPGNSEPTVLQTTDYYPFGLSHNISNTHSNKYLYNNKEMQDDVIDGTFLGWYDYGARFYDAEIGRWHVIDPHAENYLSVSPYAYVGNNPVILIDPDGKDWLYHQEKDKYVWKDNENSHENVPEGYRYIGSEDKDILTDLNIPHDFSTIDSKKIGFGLEGDGKAGAPIGSMAEATGNLSVKVETSINKDYATDDNLLGEKFQGITFTARLSQKSLSPKSDLKMDFKGSLNIQYGDEQFTSSLSAPSGPTLYKTGSITTQSFLTIPVSKISRSKSFSKATIRAGTVNPNLVISPRPIKMEWNLQRNPVFTPK